MANVVDRTNETATAVPSRRVSLFAVLASDPFAVFGITLFVLLIVGTVAANIIWPDVTIDQSLGLRNKPPLSNIGGEFFLLGTDQLGRDMVGMLAAGARWSLIIGFSVAIIAGIFGIALGVIAGYRGGRTDDFIMRLVDIQMGFPTLVLALAIIYTLGPGVRNMILVLAATSWMIYARISRAIVLKVREELYVEAARSLGASDWRILRRYIGPNLLAPMVVLFTMEVVRAILSEASLSFLGLGIQAPDTSWGVMLAAGRPYIQTAWWVVAFPGLAIFLSALSLSMIASRLRQAMDPLERIKISTGAAK